MIPIEKLLPTLTPEEAKAFRELCAEHVAATRTVEALGNDARIKRKHEIRAALNDPKTPAAELRRLGEEFASLNDSFTMARRGAKAQRRKLAPKFADVLTPLIEKAEAHADKLIDEARRAYAAHFAAFGATPSGESPLVPFLRRHKFFLDGKKNGLVAIKANPESAGSLSGPPTHYLEYPATVGASSSEDLV